METELLDTEPKFLQSLAPEAIVYELWSAEPGTRIIGPGVLDQKGKRIGQLVARLVGSSYGVAQT